MTEINWNNFKAKFNGKEKDSFQKLSYHLFCNEFENETGIFEFINQTGIETEPLLVDGQLIGFQAKFFDTKLRDNKNILISSIQKAKRENPNLNKILFYLHTGFTESSTKGEKDPKYKIDIESEAKKLNIIIDWRVHSHFERQLGLPRNKYLADYFFKINNGAIEGIQEIKRHGKNLLNAIHYDILFNKQTIKINREEELSALKQYVKNPSILILSGEGGCGKTALIKELFEFYSDNIPFYIFKAVEFDINNIQLLFNHYSNLSLNDFINIHKNESKKIIVIDSSEKISDLENQESIKEFISELIQNQWTIIFTTRQSYLEDLKFQFTQFFRLSYNQIQLNDISEKTLTQLAEKYDFALPENKRVRNRIKNLFYLNEYLISFNEIEKFIDYGNFKNTLWNRKIKKSHFHNKIISINRENCFLDIIKERSKNNSFYINGVKLSSEALSFLQKDEIISYNDVVGGYFITHDIYEEWGLDLLIERSYSKSKNHKEFLLDIGESLIIRRAFRDWLSNKLADKSSEAKRLVENVFLDSSINNIWKDEIIVATLLSGYCEEFFKLFNKEILKDDFLILKKIIFLLRIACKEIKDEVYNLVDKDSDLNYYIFTKPKGKGWECTMDLLYNNINLFKVSDLPYIIPLLKEWNEDYRKGVTTKMASLFALHFYEETKSDGGFRYSSDLEKDLVKIIVQGGVEIKNELAVILNKVVQEKWIYHSQPYYNLCSYILKSDQNALGVLLSLPKEVLEVADVYWSEDERKKDDPFYYSGYGVEKDYSLNDSSENDYSTASALHTPIYWLLRFSLQETIDFIVGFTNKSVESYTKSRLGNDVEEIELSFEGGTSQKQYISHSLWQMYRGTSSPVTPYLLQSIHMALEKFWLEKAKQTKNIEVLENWLIYLMKESKSASITSVVASIVIANPEKLFNVAKILFREIKIFSYDNIRRGNENQAKNLYSIGYGMLDRKIFQDERIKSCEDEHRKWSIESIALNYQFFGNSKLSEEEFKIRQETIWEILDGYYNILPKNKQDESEDDIKLRFLLARLDRRKMSPKVENHGNSFTIDFNPNIDDNLVERQKKSQDEHMKPVRYLGLKIWSDYKLKNDKKYKEYEQYENSPNLAFNEMKEIIEELKSNNDYEFHLFNHSIPATTSSTLLRFYSHDLSKNDIKLCKDIVMDFAGAPLYKGYKYQVSDGVDVAIKTIPFLYELFPDEIKEFNGILFLILINDFYIGSQVKICDFSIQSINENLWKKSPEDAMKILKSYIKIKPILNEKINKHNENNRFETYEEAQVRRLDLLKVFCDENEHLIDDYLLGDKDSIELNFDTSSIEDLFLIFQLTPFDTTDKYVLNLIAKILPNFTNNFFTENERKRDHSLELKFFLKYSYFILYRDESDIKRFIKPFIDGFYTNEAMASFFEKIIWAEDKVYQYEKFWFIWEEFYSKVIKMGSENIGNHYSKDIIRKYLLAVYTWRKDAKSWRSLKDREKIFFKRIVNDIGHNPVVFDSVTQFLNEIGQMFLNDGIFWVVDLVQKNKTNKLEKNTIYYTELLTRKYIFQNRAKVKRNLRIKNKILVILDFLITKGSVGAYLMREDIL